MCGVSRKQHGLMTFSISDLEMFAGLVSGRCEEDRASNCLCLGDPRAPEGSRQFSDRAAKKNPELLDFGVCLSPPAPPQAQVVRSTLFTHKTLIVAIRKGSEGPFTSFSIVLFCHSPGGPSHSPSNNATNSSSHTVIR